MLRKWRIRRLIKRVLRVYSLSAQIKALGTIVEYDEQDRPDNKWMANMHDKLNKQLKEASKTAQLLLDKTHGEED